MHKDTIRGLWALSVLVAITLSCSAVSNLSGDVNGIKETAQSVGTSVESGRQLLETGKAVVTQVQGNELVQTAQAYATKQGPRLEGTINAFATEQGPKVRGTMQAFATQQGPGLQETIQVFVTQQGPGLEQTINALVTQQGPEMLETGQAIATQVAASTGNLPTDIPLVEGEKDNLFKSDSLISYFTPLDLNTTKEFYTNEMPANGWTYVKEETAVENEVVLLYFDKPDRKASVTLSVNPLDKHTIVLIAIQQK